MLRIRTLIIIIVLAFFINFMIGVVHPYVVLYFEAFRPFLGIVALSLFIIFIIILIQNLFKPEKRISSNLCKIVLCYILMTIFGLSHYISFGGLRVHYWFVKDYDTIRTWANNVEIPEEGLLYMNGFDIPEPVKPFHPENVEVREEEGVRKSWLSWDSGFMQVGWELIICPPEEVYQVERGLLAKIQPGVYLHYEFYSH